VLQAYTGAGGVTGDRPAALVAAWLTLVLLVLAVLEGGVIGERAAQAAPA